MDFSLDVEGKAGATKAFVRKYKQIKKLLVAKKLTEAEDELAKLKSKKRWNLYEDAWFSHLKASYYLAINEDSKRLLSLNRVIKGKKYLPQSIYLEALTQAFAINVAKVNYADALENFELLSKEPEAQQTVTALKPYLAQINQKIVGDKFLVKPAVIAENDIWRHKMVRHDFSLMDIVGDLYKLEIRCDNKVITYQVKSAKTWSIPKTWGQCNIYVHGADQSSFNFVEMPLTKSS